MFLPAKKSLGQHFLNSKHVLNQIIQVSKIQENENVLEIGPGTGFLTQALLDTGAKITAIEKDNRAIKILEEKFQDQLKQGKLTLIHGDILENTESLTSLKSYKIIANIPYYLTGAILEKFLENEPRPTIMVLLVQKEVAERIITKKGKESILSISVKAFGKPRLIAKVSRNAFLPKPKVDSAILAIDDISAAFFEKNSIGIKKFFTIIKAGFAHKRKYVIRNLETVIDKRDLGEIWVKLGLNKQIRAEDLPLDSWLQISKY